MSGVRMLYGINTYRGTASIAVPTDTNIPRVENVPVSNPRPYIPSLEGTAGTSDEPACADHPCMLRCHEPTCSNPATHNDGSAGLEYLCCRDHCTCAESYTSEHMYAPDVSHTSIGSGSPDHKIYLSQKKIRLYCDRIRDLPEKEKGGIKVIRYHPDTPPDVLAWLKQNLKRLRRVLELARDGLPLRVKGKPVKINLKPDARLKCCPQPK